MERFLIYRKEYPNKKLKFLIQSQKIMQKIKLILGTALVLFFMSCEGPEGPPGLDAELPAVFEENATFSYIAEDNIWVSNLLTFNGTFDGDIFLVFISLQDGLFTPLPASIFDEFGEFQYVFDYNIDSVELQIIGDSDLSGLDAASTVNIPTRVAIIPAELISEFSATDLLSVDQIMSIGGLSEDDIITVN